MIDFDVMVAVAVTLFNAVSFRRDRSINRRCTELYVALNIESVRYYRSIRKVDVRSHLNSI